MRLLLLVPLLLAFSGCTIAARPSAVRPPLENQGEVYLYLSPLRREAAGLSLDLQGIAVVAEDGSERPLELVSPAIRGSEGQMQRLLAWGRLPPGDYQALLVRSSTPVKDRTDVKPSALAAENVARTDFRFKVSAGRAQVIALSLEPRTTQAIEPDAAPTFSAAIPAKTSWQLVGYTSNFAAGSLTVFDRRSRLVTDVIPTGQEPLGMALDARANRLYVALSGEDAIAVVDVTGNETVTRLNLAGGDRPRDVAILSDGKLFVINAGSRSASFVDPDTSQIVGRVQVGDEPWSILLDRRQPRAYVLNRWSNSITVIDVANRTAIGSIPTGPEPLWAQTNRAGTRLYLLCAGSAYMDVLSVPELVVVNRVYIGLGGAALRVDPRTDLIYVAMRGEDRVRAFEPFSFLAVDEFAVPGAVSFIAIDEIDYTLFALLETGNRIAVLDLTSRRLLSTVDVGADPYQVRLTGETR
jgi:YVTN family beta-propeller protein